MVSIVCISLSLYYFYTTLLIQLHELCVVLLEDVILLIFGNQLHDDIISLRGDSLRHETSLSLPLLITMPVPSQEREWSRIYVCQGSWWFLRLYFCHFGNACDFKLYFARKFQCFVCEHSCTRFFLYKFKYSRVYFSRNRESCIKYYFYQSYNF